MQDLCRSNKWYCRRQENRENSGDRRRVGHLLSRGKDRNEVEGGGREAPPDRSAGLWKNLLGRNLCRTRNADVDHASSRARLAPRGGPHRGRNPHQRSIVSAVRQIVTFSLFL